MIEAIVLNYLSDMLEVPVRMEEETNLPDRYVIVEKAGSGKTGKFLETSTIIIQSYAESLYEAAVLNEKVKEKMDDIITLNEITKSELNSDYNYTDAERKKYRYQAVYDLVHY